MVTVLTVGVPDEVDVAAAAAADCTAVEAAAVVSAVKVQIQRRGPTVQCADAILRVSLTIQTGVTFDTYVVAFLISSMRKWYGMGEGRKASTQFCIANIIFSLRPL